METNELHRGRLIDHIQLVVRDLKASRAFYAAVFEVLRVPMGGEGEGFFWADELFVSTADGEAAQGRLTGPSHLAFQAADLRLGRQRNVIGGCCAHTATSLLRFNTSRRTKKASVASKGRAGRTISAAAMAITSTA